MKLTTALVAVLAGFALAVPQNLSRRDAQPDEEASIQPEVFTYGANHFADDQEQKQHDFEVLINHELSAIKNFARYMCISTLSLLGAQAFKNQSTVNAQTLREVCFSLAQTSFDETRQRLLEEATDPKKMLVASQLVIATSLVAEPRS